MPLDDGERGAVEAEAFAAAAAVQAWLNVSPPGGFHRRHVHGAAAFSGRHSQIVLATL